MTLRLIAALAALVLTCACSPQTGGAGPAPATSAAAVHPTSGLPVIALTVSSAGRQHAFRVEVARSDAEQSKGLMFRTAMGADEGMIFPMQAPRSAAFWMKNTVISLDILFIGSNRRILNIAANAVPYSEDPLASAGPVSAVLELNAGRAAALGIVAGDRVAW